MLNTAVTGGAGLIGSYLVDILCDKNLSVTVIDNLYRGKKEYLKNINKVNFVQSDIIDHDRYSHTIENVDTLFHLASKVLGIGYSNANQSEMLLYNDKMTNSLFQSLERAKNLKHLIVISSSCVYDDNGPDSVPESYTQGVPEKANLGYGFAKRFLEIKAKVWCEERGIKLTIFRPFNIYGERYTWAGEHSQGLPSLVKKVLDNKENIEIWGTGNQSRTYLHAYDCAKIIIELSQRNDLMYNIFNVGLKETISLKDLTSLMCKIYNIKSNFIFRTDKPEGRYIKSADESQILKYYADFKNSLITLSDGLLRMKKWYLTNFN